jgi:PUB domain
LADLLLTNRIFPLVVSGLVVVEFEVRRIPISQPKPLTAGQDASSSSTTSAGPSSGKKQSAEADHRKLAVIAAAEAREKANKAKLKPMKQVTKTTLAKQQQLQQQLQQSNADATISPEPMTEEAKRARDAAKLGEAQLAQQLGYNPYETARASAGQARNATVAVQHGTIQAAAVVGTDESSTPIPGVVESPRNAFVAADDDDLSHDAPPEVQEALATLFSSWSHERTTLASTCTIMKTLIVNATTKGQSSSSSTRGVGDEDDSASKFRKVRLANPKIKASLVDVAGAIDVMMAVGFVLQEQEGESFLIFPKGEPGGPLWLPLVLKQLESAAT